MLQAEDSDTPHILWPPHLGCPWPNVASKNLKKSKITTMFVIEFVILSDLFGGATIYIIIYIYVGFYVVSSFYLRWLLCPYLFLSSSHIWRIQIMWSACGMLTSFRRRKRSPKMGPPLFPDGGNRFWHLQDIQKLASLHALLAQRMGLLEAPSFLIT